MRPSKRGRRTCGTRSRGGRRPTSSGAAPSRSGPQADSRALANGSMAVSVVSVSSHPATNRAGGCQVPACGCRLALALGRFAPDWSAVIDGLCPWRRTTRRSRSESRIQNRMSHGIQTERLALGDRDCNPARTSPQSTISTDSTSQVSMDPPPATSGGSDAACRSRDRAGLSTVDGRAVSALAPLSRVQERESEHSSLTSARSRRSGRQKGCRLRPGLARTAADSPQAMTRPVGPSGSQASWRTRGREAFSSGVRSGFGLPRGASIQQGPGSPKTHTGEGPGK